MRLLKNSYSSPPEVGDLKVKSMVIGNSTRATVKYEVCQWTGKYWKPLCNPFKTKLEATEYAESLIKQVV